MSAATEPDADHPHIADAGADAQADARAGARAHTRMVGLDALPDPAALEGLARRIFGEGDRPAGWFARKLRREHVTPALSVVATRASAAPDDPAGWLGYVLAGAPPSLGDAARTSGTGVVPSARGRSLASRMLEEVARRCEAAGLRRLELLAQADTVDFYLARGFHLRRRLVTAVAFASATVELDSTSTSASASSDWRSLEPEEHEPVAWLPEAWAGTEPSARRRCTFGEGSATFDAWLSREGMAWLVQRLVTRGGGSLLEAADALRRRLPAGAPVLLPLLNADAPPTHALLDAGWAAAQRSALLERPLPGSRRHA